MLSQSVPWWPEDPSDYGYEAPHNPVPREKVTGSKDGLAHLVVLLMLLFVFLLLIIIIIIYKIYKALIHK